MSYDLAVYAPRAFSAADIRAFVAEVGGLDVEDNGGDSVCVVRGSRRRYSFTIDGPYRVDDEDVPADVAGVVLGTRYFYMLMVEGSAASEVPHAVRFARRLARALDGAVVDQQNDQVWSRSGTRVVQKPQREARVAMVDVDWYCLREDLPEDVARIFVAAAERTLPEGLPRRFGESEPLQGKYADSGTAGFSAAWTVATSMLFFAGSGPCVGGYLSAGPAERFPDRFWSMSMTFLADPLTGPAWRDAVRRLFVTLADSLPAFCATAAVTSGHIWSGRSLWSDSDTEWGIRPLRAREGWMGLPPRPTWWSWFGRPYSLAGDLLPRDRATQTDQGVLYQAADAPTAAESTEAMSRWLPTALFAGLAPNPHRQQPTPLIRAQEIPDALR